MDRVPEYESGYQDPCELLLAHLSELNESALAQLDWRDFEHHCATVLERNGYRVTGGLCFRDEDRKYQVDVVGVKANRVLCLDCKAWLTGSGASRSRKAAEVQRERSARLKAHLAAGASRAGADFTFYPVVVTLKNEGTFLHDGTPVVAFQDLNHFLINFEYYEPELTPAGLRTSPRSTGSMTSR